MIARWTLEDLEKLELKKGASINVQPAQGWAVKKYSLIIGIDSGVKTGYAEWNKEKQTFELIKTMSIDVAMFRIKELHDSDNKIFVRVEDARKRKFFGESGPEKWQGAGSIKRDAKIWEDFLTNSNIPFEMVAPAANKTKLSKEQFFKMTSYSGLTSEHSRDAAMLVYKYQ